MFKVKNTFIRTTPMLLLRTLIRSMLVPPHWSVAILLQRDLKDKLSVNEALKSLFKAGVKRTISNEFVLCRKWNCLVI